MASYTALFTGLSGLSVHARKLDVIGNNIANTNTTAFKSSRMLFQSSITRDFRLGSSPGAFAGGTNPVQVGLGVNIAGVVRNFNSGGFSPTGDPRDLAIDGAGYFIVERDGKTYYTRAGSFRQDLENNLVNLNGEKLQGYGVDDNFNIVQGQLQDINIPLGSQTIAEATTESLLAGNLNAAGDLPTQGAIIDLTADSANNGFTTVSGGTPIDATTLLTDIDDPDNPGTPLFAAGQTLLLTGAEKGGKELPDAEFMITGATTVQDYMDFLVEGLGIHDTGMPNPDGNTPGVTVDPTTGIITIVGNTGTESDLSLDTGDFHLLDSAGVQVDLPFVPDKQAAADGESVRTTIVVFDSLGAQVSVDVTMVLESKGATGGTTWRYLVDSADDTDLDLRITNGTVDFDSAGQLLDNIPISITIDRVATGAESPLSFDLMLTGDAGRTTSLADEPSTLVNVFRDGLPPGTLDSFSIGEDGVISGIFSNGAIRNLGQLVLATFTNEAGLVDAGDGKFTVGANSGPAIIAEPSVLNTGRVISGALELSNVDLGQEFIELILTQTGYSANTRIIQTADELMQQLLVLGR
ncbi:MAG: flagellar hook-basal body complex protein [Phycisphaerales bacterium]